MDVLHCLPHAIWIVHKFELKLYEMINIVVANVLIDCPSPVVGVSVLVLVGIKH